MKPENAGRALQALRKIKTGGRNGGRPRNPDRCPCGIMSRLRAQERKHQCTAPEASEQTATKPRRTKKL